MKVNTQPRAAIRDPDMQRELRDHAQAINLHEDQIASLEDEVVPIEDGTFTPALLFGGGSTGMTGTFTGRYRRQGRRVMGNIRVVLTAKGSSTGNATVSGLPYASITTIQQGATLQFTTGMSGLTGAPQASILTNSTSVSLFQSAATGQSALTDASFTNTAAFNITFSYEIPE